MNTKDLLQPFCAVSDVRYYLEHIFKKGDFLCATNGHVLVRVPDDGTVEIHSSIQDNPINIDTVINMKDWPQDGFIPLKFSDPDIIEKCSTCNANSEEKISCEDCNGTGIKYQFLTMPDGRMFNYQYLLKLKVLPGIVYLPDHSDNDFGSKVMRFKFDNGIGVLMPIRK